VLCAIAIGLIASDARASSLTVLVTIDPRVPAVARRMLMAEATRIWKDAGVHLQWISSAVSRDGAKAPLQVLAIPWHEQRVDGEASVLGELIRVDQSRAVAVVSLDEAEAIAARVSSRADISRDQRLGLILGRATAHEIGHFLLNHAGHSDTGLMRPRFSDREFGDPTSTAFQVDFLEIAAK
jgi:hypothetical protein